jgi:type I restriction enzyme R subunit
MPTAKLHVSQFYFLADSFPEVYEHAARAESLTYADSRAACFYSRLALEVAVNWMYLHDVKLRDPYQTTLAARIHEPTFRAVAGNTLVAKARIIKDLGNRAAHESGRLKTSDAVAALRELFHVAYWLVRTYTTTALDPSIAFSVESLPRVSTVSTATLSDLEAVAAKYYAKAEAEENERLARFASETEKAKLEEEIKRLQAEIAAIKAEAARVKDTHDYDEAATRDLFIDLLLREAGWRFTKPGYDTEYPITGMPNKKGEGFVDYVLWGDDGKPLGLVEAKRTRKDPRIGQQQARLYADCLEKKFGQRPIIFYSNGYQHWLWDDQRYAPRAIQGFLTKDELELAIQRRTIRRTLAGEQIDRTIVDRYYQERAIRRISEAFEQDNARKALLVMATGAGKTRTVAALADLLMRANWVRRVLFLADRTALVNQAVNAFKRFLPSSSPVNLVTDRDSTGRVYVSTYPTMMGLVDETVDGKRRFGPGYFDLVVVDEAHRSVYRKYGAIFDYFDSLLVGLTATPKDEVDRDTYRLFELERGVPTDAYGLDEAVKDHYLVPPRAVSVPLKFPQEGIRYDDLTEEEKEEWDAIEWSGDGSIPTRVEPPAVNKWLFNANTVDKALEYLMREGLKVEGGDRLGKTIIFAKNRDHARFIVERFDLNYPHFKGQFARLIDFQTVYVQTLIDDFTKRDSMPHIAVSVDMLDTGIDVPEVVNLVFFKIVRSKTKFWQMLGRGTRLCADLFGMGHHKQFFFVFDLCKNFEFFNENPSAAEPKAGEPLGKRLFTSRVELVAAIQARDPDGRSDLAVLSSATTERLREEVAAMNLDNFIVRPKRQYVEKYAKVEAWVKPNLDAQEELKNEVAGLPSELQDDDIEARRFDMLILQAQLALLRHENRFGSLRERIVETLALLEELDNIPMVAAEMELILETQTDQYWQDITAPMLEALRRRLRALMKLIDIKRRPFVFSDFEDQIGEGVEIAISGVTPGTDMDRFKAKVAQYFRSHLDHLAVQKLRRNEPLTPTDLGELERLFGELGTPAEIEKVREEGGLALLVRSLVGLDREAARASFDNFTKGRKLTSVQYDFINMIIDHLTARGIVDPELLYESPFTDVNSSGVAGIFGDNEVAEIVSILDAIKKRAAA